MPTDAPYTSLSYRAVPVSCLNAAINRTLQTNNKYFNNCYYYQLNGEKKYGHIAGYPKVNATT